MRSEGFLFSWERVWGWRTVCGSFSFRDHVPLSMESMGNVRQGDVLEHVKVHFAWRAWDSVALERKLFRTAPMASSHCPWGMSEKVMCWDMWKCISRGKRRTLMVWDV